MTKKQLIMEKSLGLFAENGFHSTSIQEITDHCGISKGAFYLSFKSKDELILSLIDHIMEKATSEIDQLVREGNKKNLPYNYYHYHFDNVSKNSSLTKIFLNEQLHFVNAEFIIKVQEHTALIQESIRMMLEKTYGDKVKYIKHDMVYSIQGLTRAYTELFLFSNIKFDVEQLARSLTEKTDLLANHTKRPYITEELNRIINQPQLERFSKDRVLDSLDDTIHSVEDSIVKESLQLLKEELHKPSLAPAVLRGLFENIRYHEKCKWATFVLRNYFDIE